MTKRPEPPSESYLNELEAMTRRRKKENELTGDLGIKRPCDEILYLIRVIRDLKVSTRP